MEGVALLDQRKYMDPVSLTLLPTAWQNQNLHKPMVSMGYYFLAILSLFLPFLWT
jgi:hypothetical protein